MGVYLRMERERDQMGRGHRSYQQEGGESLTELNSLESTSCLHWWIGQSGLGFTLHAPTHAAIDLMSVLYTSTKCWHLKSFLLTNNHTKISTCLHSKSYPDCCPHNTCIQGLPCLYTHSLAGKFALGLTVIITAP